MTSSHLSRSLPASFPHTYRFRTTPDLVRKFAIPKDGNVTIHHVYLPILEYKREFFPDKVNPRSHEEPSGRVPRLIADSLATHPDEFHLLNRGILILADSCTYDNQSQFLEITIGNDETGGLADGATTDRVLSGMLDPSTLKQLDMSDQEVLAALTSGFVHIEVVSGDYESRRVRLAGARNTSVQVKEFALENLDHKFDWLKDALDGSQFKDRIRYRENDPQPVDVRTVLALMTLFHPKWTEEGREPVSAYTSKGGILSYFRDDAWLPGYKQLASVVTDILRLYDHVHQNFQPQYAKFNREAKDSGAKFGRRREINYRADRPHVLPLTETEINYLVPDGWLYPTVAALRVLLDFNNGSATWKTDPFVYFDEYGAELVGDVQEESASLGFNPQSVGKKRLFWSNLRSKVELRLVKNEQANPIA
jgi:hypothetical protein